MFKTKKKHPVFSLFLLCLALTLILSMLAPSVALAQGSGTGVLASTSDGSISVLLPANWVYMDKTNDATVQAFTSQLYFGETMVEASKRYNNFAGANDVFLGVGGFVALMNTPLVAPELGGIVTAENTLDFFLDSFTGIGAEIVATPADMGDLLIGGHEGLGAVFDASDITGQMGFIVTLETPLGVIVSVTTTTAETFSEYSDTMADVLDSINVPGSTSTTSNPPNNTSGPGLGSIDEQNISEVVATADGEMSLELPLGWISEDRLSTEDAIWVFGDSQAAVDTRVINFLEDQTHILEGIGGVAFFIDLENLQAPNPVGTGYVSKFLNEQMIPIIQDSNGQMLGTVAEFSSVGDQAALFNYQYTNTGERGLLSGVVYEEPRLMVILLISGNNAASFDANFDLLAGIIDTLKVPGEVVETPSTPNTNNPTTPSLPGLGNNSQGNSLPGLGSSNTSALEQRVVNAQNTFDFGIPKNWVSVDKQNVVYFGENQAAVNGFEQGSGQLGAAGAYLLQPRATFDTAGTMTLEQLFNTIFADSTFSSLGVNSGLVGTAKARWAEGTFNETHGYWVVVDFGDQVAIFILTTPEADWRADSPTLKSIFESARYNALGLQ